jgi:hypothetical protein
MKKHLILGILIFGSMVLCSSAALAAPPASVMGVEAYKGGDWDVSINNDSTTPVPVTFTNKSTHMGVPANDIINLRDRGPFNYLSLVTPVEFLKDPYEVPQGKCFVATDFKGKMYESKPNAYASIVMVPMDADDNVGAQIIDISGMADTNGDVRMERRISSGIVIQPGAKLFIANYYHGEFVKGYTEVYGYLVDCY